MNYSDYYREQASHYRSLAASAENDAIKQELLESAAACEEAADDIDDHLASGAQVHGGWKGEVVWC